MKIKLLRKKACTKRRRINNIKIVNKFNNITKLNKKIFERKKFKLILVLINWIILTDKNFSHQKEELSIKNFKTLTLFR
jgi:hypothetical protein